MTSAGSKPRRHAERQLRTVDDGGLPQRSDEVPVAHQRGSGMGSLRPIDHRLLQARDGRGRRGEDLGDERLHVGPGNGIDGEAHAAASARSAGSCITALNAARSAAIRSAGTPGGTT